jgi:hypothetical protein
MQMQLSTFQWQLAMLRIQVSSLACLMITCNCSFNREHACSAPELFGKSAFRKAESASLDGSPVGYSKAESFKECAAKPNGCCAVYFIPITAGTYSIKDKSCSGPLASVVVSGTAGGTLDAFTATPTPSNLLGAEEATWPQWKSAKQIDVALGALSYPKTLKNDASVALSSSQKPLNPFSNN